MSEDDIHTIVTECKRNGGLIDFSGADLSKDTSLFIADIVASNEAIELTINRVSGKAVLKNEELKNGMCKLTNKTKF